jgi:hypothetical protein
MQRSAFRLNRLQYRLEVVPRMWHVSGLALVAEGIEGAFVQEESWATNVWTASWDRPWEMNFGRRLILSCGD